MLFLEDMLDSYALLFDAIIELGVHLSMLAFLINEVLDLTFQLRVCDRMAKVTDTGDEESLTLWEQQTHRIEEPRFEGVACEPVPR